MYIHTRIYIYINIYMYWYYDRSLPAKDPLFAFSDMNLLEVAHILFLENCVGEASHKPKEEAGLPKNFRALHGLRHVYASMLASSGQVDMYTLQKLLTHKSPAMTQRYAHLRDDALKGASDLAGDIISQAMNGNKEKKVANLKK